MAEPFIAEFSRLSNEQPCRLEPDAGLSDRERQVLVLVARGKSNREIATLLSLSVNTVKNHVHNILKKLHLSSRVEATLYALRRNLTQ